MPSLRNLFLTLILITSVSSIVRSRSSGGKAGGGGGGSTGYGPAQIYLNGSKTATRNETDLQTCYTAAVATGWTKEKTMNCKGVAYSFTTTWPCTSPASEAKDRISPQALVCATKGSTVCTQMLSQTWIDKFADSAVKPAVASWRCSGAAEHCCGFECCTQAKEPVKWIWIVILAVVLLVVLPAIIITIYCLVAKKKTGQNSNYGGQSVSYNNAGFNAPPRAY